jgi:hypothetical protein
MREEMKKLILIFSTAFCVLICGAAVYTHIQKIERLQLSAEGGVDYRLFQPSLNFPYPDPVRNPKYVNFKYEFKSLADDEILTYSYENINFFSFFTVDSEKGIIKIEPDPCDMKGIIRLYAENIKTGEDRLIGSWETFWVGFRFSADMKTGILFLGRNSWFGPLLKIDGRLGKITYLIDAGMPAMNSRDSDYLLSAIYGEIIDDAITEYKIAVIDVQNAELIRVLNWEITPLRGCNIEILRNYDNGYDFKLEYGGDLNVYAVAYYDVKSDTLDTVFDVTGYGIDNQYAKRYKKHSDMELGLPQGTGKTVL